MPWISQRAAIPRRMYSRSISLGFNTLPSKASKSMSSLTIPCALSPGRRPPWCSSSLNRAWTAVDEREVVNLASWLLKGEWNPLPTASVSINSPKKMSGNALRNASRAAANCACLSVLDPMQSKQQCPFFTFIAFMLQMYEMFLLLLHGYIKEKMP